MSILSEIYFHLSQDQSCKSQKSPHILPTYLVEEFEKCLNQDEKSHFHKVLDKWIEMESISNEEHFNLGFRSGMKLMIEVLGDS